MNEQDVKRRRAYGLIQAILNTTTNEGPDEELVQFFMQELEFEGADYRKAERARCAAICDAHAAELQATADKYPAGTAACFVEEARELGRRMRGER